MKKVWLIILLFICIFCVAEKIPQLMISASGSVIDPGEKIQILERSSCGNFSWSLRDWEGKIVQTGNASGDFFLTDPLVPGYYIIEAENQFGKDRKTFGILPSGNILGTKEMPYSIDVATTISTVSQYAKGDLKRSLDFFAELCRRAGVRFVRDRAWWPKNYHWGHIPLVVEAFSSRGISISMPFHDVPKEERNIGERMPNNLLSIYKFGVEAAKKFRNQIQVWEYWNEQDGGGTAPGKDAAWNFTATFKAFTLGAHRADPGVRVTPGSFATIGKSLPYIECQMKNLPGEYSDICNIHIYGLCERYPILLKEARKWMKQGDMANAEIWITENGTKIEGNALGKPPIPLEEKNIKAHSPEQEMLHAEFVVKAQLKMQFLGVRRTFAFVLPPYNEYGGKKDWGFLRRDYSAKPAYFAFASLIHSLGNGRMLGAWDAGADVEAYLFEQENRTQSLVLWAKSNVDQQGIVAKKIKVRIPACNMLRGNNIFGTPITVYPSENIAEIEVTRYPVYLHGLNSLTPALPPVYAGRMQPFSVTRKNRDLSIVFSLYPKTNTLLNGENSALQILPQKGPCEVLLRIANLSTIRKKGKIECNGMLKGIPEIIDLSPLSQQDFRVVIAPLEQNLFDLVVQGKFEGKDTSPLVVPVVRLDRPGIVLPVWESERWKINAAGKRMAFVPNPASKTMTIKADLNPKRDKWIYPEFALSKESLHKASGIAFEIKMNKPTTTFFSLVMLSEKSLEANYVSLSYRPPTTEWTENFIPLKHLDCSSLRFIRIGINPKEPTTSYSIRNLRIIPGD